MRTGSLGKPVLLHTVNYDLFCSLLQFLFYFIFLYVKPPLLFFFFLNFFFKKFPPKPHFIVIYN